MSFHQEEVKDPLSKPQASNTFNPWDSITAAWNSNFISTRPSSSSGYVEFTNTGEIQRVESPIATNAPFMAGNLFSTSQPSNRGDFGARPFIQQQSSTYCDSGDTYMTGTPATRYPSSSGSETDMNEDNIHHDRQQNVSAEELFDGHLFDLKLDPSSLKIHSNLGQGYFADTYQATFQPNPNEPPIEVAVKKIVLSSFRQQSDVALFVKEVEIWSKLRHPNLVQLLGYVVNNSERYSVMELLGPSLYDVLQMERKGTITLSIQQKLNISTQVAEALAYMHSWKPPVLHRDLTPSNVLLSHDLSVTKVGDFGLAREALAEGMTMTTAVGNCVCMAPEVFKGGKYHTYADIYSYGMLLYQIWANPEDICQGYSPQVWASLAASSERKRPPLEALDYLSEPKLVDLIVSCWHHEPRARPQFHQIVEYLQSLN